MSMLNERYLLQLSEKYDIEYLGMFTEGYRSYRLLLNRKEKIDIILCDNYKNCFDIDKVLDKISLLDASSKSGNIYLCIMPYENPKLELCTFFNGKSFVHFIFFNIVTNALIYDKKIYYAGSKRVKQLIDIYQNCFNESWEVENRGRQGDGSVS